MAGEVQEVVDALRYLLDHCPQVVTTKGIAVPIIVTSQSAGAAERARAALIALDAATDPQLRDGDIVDLLRIAYDARDRSDGGLVVLTPDFVLAIVDSLRAAYPVAARDDVPSLVARLDARIGAAAFAQFKCDTSHANEADALLDWGNSPKDRNEYMRDACVVLAAADAVSASECEKLKAALAALVEAWDSEDVQADFTSMGSIAHAHGWRSNGATIQPQLDAARALVGSAPRNEADE